MSVRAHFTAEASDITISGTDPNVVWAASGEQCLRLGVHDGAGTTTTVGVTTNGTTDQMYQAGIWITDQAPPKTSPWPRQLQEDTDFFLHKIYGYETQSNANAYFSWKVGFLQYTPGAGDVHTDYTYHQLTSGTDETNWPGWVISDEEMGSDIASQDPMGGIVYGVGGSHLLDIHSGIDVAEGDRVVVEWGAQNSLNAKSLGFEYGAKTDDPNNISAGVDIAFSSEITIPINFPEKYQNAWGLAHEIECPFGSGIDFADINISQPWLITDWGDSNRTVARRGADEIVQQMWTKQDDEYFYASVHAIVDGCIQDSDHAYLFFCGSNNWFAAKVPDHDDYCISIDINGRESQTDDPSVFTEGGNSETGPRLWRGAQGHPEADVFPYGWNEAHWHTGATGFEPRGAEFHALDNNRVEATFSGIDGPVSGYTEAGLTFYPYQHLTDGCQIVGNEVHNLSVGKSGYVASGDSRQDVGVEMDWVVSGFPVSGGSALLARVDPLSLDANYTYYEAEWKVTGTGEFDVFLEKQVSGVETDLISGVVSGVAIGEEVHCRFLVEDNSEGNVDLTLYWNGIVMLQYTDSGVDKITASGYQGFELYEPIASIDNFHVGDPTRYTNQFLEEGVDFRFAAETAGSTTCPDPNDSDLSTVGKSARTTFKIKKSVINNWDGYSNIGFMMNSACDVKSQGNILFPPSLGVRLDKPHWNYPGIEYYLTDNKTASSSASAGSEMDLRPLMAAHLHAPQVIIEGASDGLATAEAALTILTTISLAATSDGTSTAEADLAAELALSVDAAGEAAASAAAQADRNALGDAAGLSTVAGILSTQADVTLVATSDGTSTADGDLAAELALSVQADGLGSADASASADLRTIGDSAGIATTAAVLSSDEQEELAGTSDGTSTATADMAAELALSVDVSGEAAASATAQADRNALGDSAGLSTADSTLTTTATTPLFAT